MKLSVFNSENTPKQSGGRGESTPAITFNKSGAISFNRAAVELMALSPGSKVSFAQDDNDKSNWYVFVDSKQGFGIRSKDKNGCMQFSHKSLCISVCGCFALDTTITHRFLMGGEPTKEKGVSYYGILVGLEAVEEIEE